jgi:hypothetical protein
VGQDGAIAMSTGAYLELEFFGFGGSEALADLHDVVAQGHDLVHLLVALPH